MVPSGGSAAHCAVLGKFYSAVKYLRNTDFYLLIQNVAELTRPHIFHIKRTEG